MTRAGAEIPVTEGMAIQVGDIVNTGPGASVYVQVYTGATATVAEKSHAAIEAIEGDAALLDLTGGGNVTAQIEPNKGHKFGIRTPKGVAAAKGTVYHVNVNGTNYTVVTMNGSVTVAVGTFGSATTTSNLTNNNGGRNGAATLEAAVSSANSATVGAGNAFVTGNTVENGNSLGSSSIGPGGAVVAGNSAAGAAAF